MQSTIKKLVSHPLITGGSIVFVGSFAANLLNYIFNLAMGRMLSVSDYGLLISLTSFFVLLGIFSNATNLVISKFAAKYFAVKDKAGMHGLYKVGSKLVFLLAGVICVILLALSGVITSFLHVPTVWMTVVVIIGVFFSILYSMPTGVFQGFLQMSIVAFLNILQPLTKIIVGVLLVYLGYHAFGAIVGITIASIVAAVVGYGLIFRNYKKISVVDKDLHLESSLVEDIKKYSYPIFLATLGLTMMTSTDVILVRHFMSATTSGYYAALSLMGKAILYFTFPINFVFFPLIAQKKERKERLFNTVVMTFGIVTLASVCLSFIYFAFPNLILQVFFPGNQYKILANYLGLFSLYILLSTLVALFNSFFLSIEKTEIYKFTLSAGIIQIVLLSMFHESLYQVIGVLFAVNALLLAGFLVYYLKHGKD